jgi:hypothetical protein
MPIITKWKAERRHGGKFHTERACVALEVCYSVAEKVYSCKHGWRNINYWEMMSHCVMSQARNNPWRVDEGIRCGQDD